MRCPRCVDHGAIGKALIGKTCVYVCNSCRALWTHPQAIGAHTYVDLDLFLESRTADGTECSLSNLDLNWDGSRDVQDAETAVETEPENLEARLQLASLLLADQPAKALAHVAFVLGRDPTHLQALKTAACHQVRRAATGIVDVKMGNPAVTRTASLIVFLGFPDHGWCLLSTGCEPDRQPALHDAVEPHDSDRQRTVPQLVVERACPGLGRSGVQATGTGLCLWCR